MNNSSIVKVTCTERIRDNKGKIIGYVLKDINGNLKEVTPYVLKKAMNDNRISVDNLIHTSDNRIIAYNNVGDRIDSRYIISNKDDEVKKVLSKANIIGMKPLLALAKYAKAKNIPHSEIIRIIVEHNIPVDNIIDIDDQKITFFDYDAAIEYPECSILVNNMSMLFAYYGRTSYLDLSKFDTSNVTDMNRMFMGAKNLVKLDLRSFNTEKVTNMSRMFRDCDDLKEIDLSSFDTSNVSIMDDMFYGCVSLKSLDLTNFKDDKLIIGKHMFYGCDQLGDFKYNENATKILLEFRNSFAATM